MPEELEHDQPVPLLRVSGRNDFRVVQDGGERAFWRGSASSAPRLPLTAPSLATDQLLGGPGTRPAPVDALAARTLTKGEALNPPPGRADDFTWPRREVGREQTKGEAPVASASPNSLRDVRAQVTTPASQKLKKHPR